MTRILLGLAATTLLFMAMACGSYPAPNQRMATAEAAIRGAMERGAAQVPRAQLHLKLAQEQTEKAKRYMQDGLNMRAEQALLRAKADAELAVSIAVEDAMVAKAAKAKSKVSKIKGGR